MASDITLSPADIELLREACEAKGGLVHEREGDLQARFARTVAASHLTRLGYLEAVDGGWRIKPALKAQVRAALREWAKPSSSTA